MSVLSRWFPRTALFFDHLSFFDQTHWGLRAGPAPEQRPHPRGGAADAPRHQARPQQGGARGRQRQVLPHLRARAAQRDGVRQVPVARLGRHEFSRHLHGADAQQGVHDGQQDLRHSAWGHDRVRHSALRPYRRVSRIFLFLILCRLCTGSCCRNIFYKPLFVHCVYLTFLALFSSCKSGLFFYVLELVQIFLPKYDMKLFEQRSLPK